MCEKLEKMCEKREKNVWIRECVKKKCVKNVKSMKNVKKKCVKNVKNVKNKKRDFKLPHLKLTETIEILCFISRIGPYL